MGFRRRSFGNTSATSSTLAPSLREEADAAASDPGGLPLFKPFERNFCTFFAVVVTTVLAAPASNAAIKLTSPEATFLSVMNQTRHTHGLAPLRVDPNLVRAARWQSSDMLDKGYFSHGAFAERMAAFRVRGARVAENLAWGQGSLGTAEVIVREWLNSPHHRKILLRAGYRRVGIGTAVGTFSGRAGARIVTADFAGR